MAPHLTLAQQVKVESERLPKPRDIVQAIGYDQSWVGRVAKVDDQFIYIDAELFIDRKGLAEKVHQVVKSPIDGRLRIL